MASSSRPRAIVLMSFMFLTVGIMFCLNDILFPVVKSMFSLSYAQTALIQVTFYSVYLLLPLLTAKSIATFGYVRNIVIALIVCTIGSLLFIPAYFQHSFALVLTAIFFLSSGIAVINIAANPYVALLGSPTGAQARLNLVQAFSRVGYAVTPILAIWLIDASAVSHARIHVPYAIVGGLCLALCILIATTKLPTIAKEDDEEQASWKQVLENKNLTLGIPAMFFYVGAEACTSGFFISYLQSHNIDADSAATYLTLYYVAAATFALVGAGLVRLIRPSLLMIIFGAGMLLCYATILLNTTASVPYSLIATGAFLSIMFPTLFGLAIEGLGNQAEKASALLNVAIVGGAIFPLLQGIVADAINVGLSYAVPAACIAVVVTYAWYIEFRHNVPRFIERP